jgi:hypothetical protein
MRNTADVTGGKPIAVLLKSISGVSAINPLVTFYDIHGGKREVLFFYLQLHGCNDDTEVFLHFIIYKPSSLITLSIKITTSKSVGF